MGFVTLIFLAGTYHFYVDQWDIFLPSLFNQLGWPEWKWVADYRIYALIGIWFLTLATLIVQMDTILSKKIITKQNYFKIFYWVLVISLLQIFIIENLAVYHLSLLVVPVTFLFGEYLVNSSTSWSTVIVNVLLAIGLLLPFSGIIISSFGF